MQDLLDNESYSSGTGGEDHVLFDWPFASNGILTLRASSRFLTSSREFEDIRSWKTHYRSGGVRRIHFSSSAVNIGHDYSVNRTAPPPSHTKRMACMALGSQSVEGIVRLVQEECENEMAEVELRMLSAATVLGRGAAVRVRRGSLFFSSHFSDSPPLE